MNIAIILSGGQGCRMGADVPKQYIEIGGKPVIAWCRETFVKQSAIDALIIVLDLQWQTFVASLPVLAGSGKPVWYAPSGRTRQQSIYNGLKRAKECGASDEDIVVIHDGVRPLVDEERRTYMWRVTKREAKSTMPCGGGLCLLGRLRRLTGLANI